MAEQNTKCYLIGIKFGTRRFLQSLITNPSSKFRNSRCLIQYGDPKYKNSFDIKLGIQGTFRNKRSLLDWDKSFWGQANVLEVLNVHMNEIYKI